MTITEFLEARIAEDEARAVEARDWVASGPTPHFPWYGLPGDRAGRVLGGAHPLISAMSPARVLAECAAKRAIAGLHKEGADQCDEHNAMFESIPCPTIRALAAVYADHPDYQEAWRA